MMLLAGVWQPSRWGYLARSAWLCTRSESTRCPNCGGSVFEVVKRKYLVTGLARCGGCRILYRMPVDPPGFNGAFYQQKYASGFTTETPTPRALSVLKATRFRGSPKDFSERIALLRALGVTPGQRVLDFGASWGYGVWQLLQAGFAAEGFEISRPRAAYAREMLEVPVKDELGDVQGLFDAVLACHVLEHLQQPAALFEWLPRVLKPGGRFVAITPNGSIERSKADPTRYHRGWGQVHPLYLDEEFYDVAFSGRPKVLASLPHDLAAFMNWDGTRELRCDLTGAELLCVVAF